MPSTVNPILPLTALLRATMPAVYAREMIYDPTWDDPAYNTYSGQRVIPAVGSIVKDTDITALWVIEVDPVTYVPTYTAVSLSTQNDDVVSLLNYGNSVLRLYVDHRELPYPASPDAKCVFIGKSPRFYRLTRYPGQPNQTIISQYFDSTGTLRSNSVPLVALDSSRSSWYLPRCNISVILEFNEEILVEIFDEGGAEVYSAKLFAKQSSVINENVMYAPTIVGMTVGGNQRLSNGNFFLYEKQDFESLGLNVTLLYSDGSTDEVPIDNLKCFMYGANDFISSFSGLTQYITIKYFKSVTENITPGLTDPSGSMITVRVPVTVVPNGFNTTAKITALPYYNSSLARYTLRYWMYFANGDEHVDVTPYVTIVSGSLTSTASSFGTPQSYRVAVNMNSVDPVRYPVNTVYSQNIYITFFPPTGLVKYSIADASDSTLIYGLDNVSSRRPVLKYDTVREQYFIPSNIFGNTAAFINSFYTKGNPPYDPVSASIPQQPTHFVVRDLTTGLILTSSRIPVASYANVFNMTENIRGTHNNSSVIFEFINQINSTTSNVLYGVIVEVSSGTYIV